LSALSISLGPNGRVRLIVSPELSVALNDFSVLFPSGERISETVAEVDLEDFLVHLATLNRWKHGEPSWHPDLAHLVRTNHQDDLNLRAALASDRIEAGHFLPAEGWTAQFTDFQLRDIGRLLRLSHGANFSVPGAGKTRVGLAVYAERRARGEVRRLLIVAPKSAYTAWQSENLECFGGQPLAMRILEDGPTDCEVLVVNYERLPQKMSFLSNWIRKQPTMIIADEGHRMKRGPRGAYGRAMLALAPLARHRLIMTGTPAPNGVEDLESVLSFAWPGSAARQVRAATAGGDLAAASRQLRPLFVRTTKSELNLPPLEVRIAEVELPPLHRKVYDALLGHFRSEAPDLAELGRIVMYLLMAADCPALVPLGATSYDPIEYSVPPLDPGVDPDLRTLMRNLPTYEMSPKYLAAARIASDNAAAGRKTIVWSTFVRSLTSLELLMRSLQPAVVHGGTTDREDQLERFATDPSCKVLISNPATLGEGINLHHIANDAVYVDRDFAAGRYLQSIDRIHRLGLPPDARVRVTVLSAAGTIDNVVEQRLSQKLQFMGAVLDDPNIQQLADLADDPSIAAGLSKADADAIRRYLGHDSA